jgi:hypothetical protein
MPAIDFRDYVKSLLTAMTRPGVLREADRENLVQLLEEHEKQLVAIVQRIILEWLERLSLAGDFKKALKKGSADMNFYLAIMTPDPRLFFFNAVTRALTEIIATRSPYARRER